MYISQTFPRHLRNIVHRLLGGTRDVADRLLCLIEDLVGALRQVFDFGVYHVYHPLHGLASLASIQRYLSCQQVFHVIVEGDASNGHDGFLFEEGLVRVRRVGGVAQGLVDGYVAAEGEVVGFEYHVAEMRVYFGRFFCITYFRCSNQLKIV